MVNEEVFGGLKSALERGQTLERAMLTLFNSGYKREDIEEAARALMEIQPSAQLTPPIKTVPMSPVIKQAPQVLAPPRQPKSFEPMTFQQQSTQIQRPIQPQIQKPIQKQPIQIQQPVQVQKPIQKVSNYGEEKQKEERPKREKAIIFILVFLLAFLLGLLAVIFLFKQQLIDYFSNFFG